MAWEPRLGYHDNPRCYDLSGWFRKWLDAFYSNVFTFLTQKPNSSTWHSNIATKGNPPSSCYEVPRHPSLCPHESRIEQLISRYWWSDVHILFGKFLLQLNLYRNIHSAERNLAAGPKILPPRPIRTKGRPRKARITSAIEGHSRQKRIKLEEDGDGPGRRKCSKCGERGHYSTTFSRHK